MSTVLQKDCPDLSYQMKLFLIYGLLVYIS
jgi:hypothetical protein